MKRKKRKKLIKEIATWTQISIDTHVGEDLGNFTVVYILEYSDHFAVRCSSITELDCNDSCHATLEQAKQTVEQEIISKNRKIKIDKLLKDL